MNVEGLVFVTPPCPNPDCADGRIFNVLEPWPGYPPCSVCNGSGDGTPRLEWRCFTCNGEDWVSSPEHWNNCDGTQCEERDCPVHVTKPCPDPNHHLHGLTAEVRGVHDEDADIVIEWTPAEGTS